MRQDDQPALLLALPGPLGQQDLDGVAQSGFVGPAGGHRRNDPAAIAQQRDVPQHVLTVLRSHAHQVFAIATGLRGAPRGPAIEIADVGHQLAPLAGQQVDDIHALCGPLQQGRSGRKKMHVRVGRDPALLAPGQHLFNFDGDLPRVGGHVEYLAYRPDLKTFGDFDVHLAQRQIDGRLPGNVGAEVRADWLGERVQAQSRQVEMDKVGAIVLEPGRVGDAVAIDRRQILPRLTVNVQLDRYRLGAAAAVHHLQRHPLRCRSDRLDGGG